MQTQASFNAKTFKLELARVCVPGADQKKNDLLGVQDCIFTGKEVLFHRNLYQFCFTSQHGWCRFVFWNSEPCSRWFCLQWSCSKVRTLLIYPLVSKPDGQLISPYIIHTLSKRQLMRIKKRITYGTVLFSELQKYWDKWQTLWNIENCISLPQVEMLQQFTDVHLNWVMEYSVDIVRVVSEAS